jgi:hypothetical protein
LAHIDQAYVEVHDGTRAARLSGQVDPTLSCFVIGPIGNRLAALGSPERETYEESIRVMEEVIEPACQSVGLSPVRADSLARAGEITEQIFRRLHDDDVVIADLTGANPNVMYELGLRHTRAKLTVQIGEYGRLPFDVNTIRTVQFSRSASGLISAREELTHLLAAGIAGDYDPVSATRLWTELDSAAPLDIAASDAGEDGERAEDGDRGFLEIMVEWEDQLDELVPALEGVNQHIVRLGDLAERSTAKIEESDAAGKGMRGRLQVATQYATELGSIAVDLVGAVEHYGVVLRTVSDGTLALISNIEHDPEQLEDENVLEFAVTTRGAAAATRSSMSAFSGLAAAVAESAQVSRVVRDPSQKVLSALQQFAAVTSTIDEWDRRLQALGVPEPPPDWDDIQEPSEPNSGTATPAPQPEQQHRPQPSN